MKTNLKSLAVTAMLLCAAGSASAAVTVAFAQPDKFRDMPFVPSDREQVLKDLSEHFAYMGKDLPPGQDLRIEVLDIDLAGTIWPRFYRSDNVRIMRGGADWPRITLRYTLESNGQVISSGEETLSDMMYMNRLPRYADGDTLRYEKRMIDDWFKQKFAISRSARR